MRKKIRVIPPRAIKVDLPDTRQTTNYSCGASALQAICGYFVVGPAEEEDYIRDLKLDPRVGAHAFQIKRAALKYGLRVSEKKPMGLAHLKRFLDTGKPVMLMLQAWDAEGSTDGEYANEWDEGHWVVAIGYDRAGVYFEDPSLAVARGFIPYDELIERWHDTGPHGVHVQRFGMAIWKPGVKKSAHTRRARKIE